jgi:hypothetical protein
MRCQAKKCAVPCSPLHQVACSCDVVAATSCCPAMLGWFGPKQSEPKCACRFDQNFQLRRKSALDRGAPSRLFITSTSFRSASISVAVRSLIFFRMLVCANTELPQQRAAALRTSARSGNGAVQTSWRPATAKHHCPAFIGRPTRTAIPGPPPQRHRDHRDAQTRATRASRRVLLA